MSLATKKLIAAIISASLLANLLLGIHISQMRNNQIAIDKSHREQIVELKKDNKKLRDDNKDLQDEVDEYKRKYFDCLELNEELQNQMGVYSNVE